VDGIYKAGGNIKPPLVKNHVEAEFSDEARQESNRVPNFRATSFLNLIVDIKGKPQDICVEQPAGFGLDIQAVKAAKKYRFQPATKDGTPVAVLIKVKVNFIRVN
jgi:protein TonB